MKSHGNDERVILSLTFGKSADGRMLTLDMSGMIAAPVASTERHILDFTNYPAWMDFVHQVISGPADSSMEVRASLLKHALRSCVSYLLTDGGMTWEVTDGTLRGAKGTVSWKDDGNSLTSVTLRGTIVRPTFPLPDFMIRWGAQWYLARTARTFIGIVEKYR